MDETVYRPTATSTPDIAAERLPPARSSGRFQVAGHLFADRAARRELLEIDRGAGQLGRLIASDPSTRHWVVDGVGAIPGHGLERLPGAGYRRIRAEPALAMPTAHLRRYDAVCLFHGFGAAEDLSCQRLLRHLLESLGPDGRLVLSVPLGVGTSDEPEVAVPASSVLRLQPVMSFIDADELVGTFVFARRSLALLHHFQPTHDARFDRAAGRLDLQATGHPADGVLYLHGDNAHPLLSARIVPVEAQVDALIRAGNLEGALVALLVGVHDHHRGPGIAHRALYYPEIDRQVESLSQRLETAFLATATDPPGAGADLPATTEDTLIVATELYRIGGHSKVIDDIVREARSPVIVLTDVFAGYRTEPADHGWVRDAYPGARVIVLPPQSLWSKCMALRQLTQRLRPARILYFNHHQDPVAFVGTLGHIGSHKVFVHHTDHNPCIGATLPGMAHVDFTDELAAICSRELGVPAVTLPLHVADQGRRSFAPTPPAEWSVVTSGTMVKFARSGELALRHVVHAVLGATRGNFHHIGPLDADWVAEIRDHLAGVDIDPARFVAVGPVASLWQALAGLPAHVYLGSAPVGGGRAAAEVQGCGYPLAHYRPADTGSLVAVESIYASPELGWSRPEDLPAILRKLAASHAGYSDAARAHYAEHFSQALFRRVLQESGAI